MGKQRKITEAEKRRAERFRIKADALKNEGYEESSHTIDIIKANIFAVMIMLPFAAMIAVPYLVRHGIDGIGSFKEYLLYLILFIVLTAVEMVIHEAIHGLTWGLLSPDGFSTIEFGFIKEYLTPYCYCGSPLTKGQYLAGSIMPTIFLGFIQGLIAIWTGNLMIFILSMILMFGGGGDFLVDYLLLRYKKKHKTLIMMDHPTELGFVTFEK